FPGALLEASPPPGFLPGELFLRPGVEGVTCFLPDFLTGSSKLTPRVVTKLSMTCSSFCFGSSCARATEHAKTRKAARVRRVLRRMAFLLVRNDEPGTLNDEL